MWIVWIVGLVLIGVGVYLWRTRFAGVGTDRSAPPYGSAGGATAGSDETRIVKPKRPQEAQ